MSGIELAELRRDIRHMNNQIDELEARVAVLEAGKYIKVTNQLIKLLIETVFQSLKSKLHWEGCNVRAHAQELC